MFLLLHKLLCSRTKSTETSCVEGNFKLYFMINFTRTHPKTCKIHTGHTVKLNRNRVQHNKAHFCYKQTRLTRIAASHGVLYIITLNAVYGIFPWAIKKDFMKNTKLKKEEVKK